VIAVDTNILVYSQRSDSPFHVSAARKVAQLAEGGTPWGIPWPCVHEFLAIVTNPRIFNVPSKRAFEYLDNLFQSPNLVLLGETDLHWATLKPLLEVGRIAGGRVHDARIAAICMQHGVDELWSADRDFGRFPELNVVNPLLP
jgi:toxin-antitoxin system PIN domain toxin